MQRAEVGETHQQEAVNGARFDKQRERPYHPRLPAATAHQQLSVLPRHMHARARRQALHECLRELELRTML